MRTISVSRAYANPDTLTIGNVLLVVFTFLSYKCILFSSPTYDLHWKTDEFRRAICVTDLASYKKLLCERNTYTILTYNHYKLHFDPLEYIAFRERPLNREIKYYAAFHLTENEKNKKLEQELVRYLTEILET